MSGSLAILFLRRFSSSFLGHEAIVYQANPQRCDKISDCRVRQYLQLGLPRILQPGRSFPQRRIRVARVAYQFRRAVGKALAELHDALARQFAGLRNAAKMIGRGNPSAVGLFPRCARRRSKLSGVPANWPALFRRLETTSRSASGGPSVRFKWTPIPNPGADRADSTAPANAAPLANSEVLVTIPWLNASRMPRFTPSVHPRSSALTIRLFTTCPAPGFRPVR